MSVSFDTVIHHLQPLADGILGIELRGRAQGALPPVEAGAHIDLHLPNGLVRSYSLLNEPGETRFYRIAVLKDRASRGGSRCVHEDLRVGQTLRVSGPRNHFRLDESAPHSVLLAGGIGVTPILCMARRLRQLGRSAELLYCVRSRRGAALVDELQALGFPMQLHVDDEQGGPADLAALLSARAGRPGTHWYACGPAAMLDAFVASCNRLGLHDHHIERFAAAPATASDAPRQTYAVELRRSGRQIVVGPEQSLLRALLDAGVAVDHACEEGICGSCRTRVIAGEPDHRDSVLTPAEQASQQLIMPCVSGCRSAALVLDL